MASSPKTAAAFFALVLHLLVLLTCIAVFDRLSAQVVSPVIIGPRGQISLALQPARTAMKKGTKYYYSGYLLRSRLSRSQRLRVYPVGCLQELTIGGRMLDLKPFRHQLCSNRFGFEIDVRSYLGDGPTHFTAKLESRGGLAGLRIAPLNEYVLYSPAGICIVLLFLSFIAHLCYFLNFDLGSILIVLAGALLRFLYLGYTDAYLRAHDVIENGGHLDYLVHLFQHHFELPNPYTGWEYHQPPLYYYLSAFLGKFILTSGSLHYLLFFQCVSLTGGVVLLVFAIRIASIAFRNRSLSYYLACLLIACWPSGVVHSARISNGMLASCLYVVALYYLMQWYWERRDKDFWRISAAAAAGLAAMSTALIGMAVIAIIYLFSFHNSPNRIKHAGLGLCMALIFGISFAAVKGRQFAAYAKGERKDWIAGGTFERLSPALKLKNEPALYLTLPLEQYLSPPFASSWTDKSGRQYFWSFLLKSSLYGEFNLKGDAERRCAVILNVCLMGLIFYACAGILLSRSDELLKNLPLLLNLILPIGAIMAYRFTYPAAPLSDFRHIYPALVSFCIFVMLGASRLGERSLLTLKLCGCGLAALFIILSAALIV